jgi:hypothetical protein
MKIAGTGATFPSTSGAQRVLEMSLASWVEHLGCSGYKYHLKCSAILWMTLTSYTSLFIGDRQPFKWEEPSFVVFLKKETFWRTALIFQLIRERF